MQSFPEVGSKFQISNGGGDTPVWRSDGKEPLYFGPNGSSTSVPVETGATFRAGASQVLCQVSPPNASNGSRAVFALDRNGQRILVNRGAEDTKRKEITLVANLGSGSKEKMRVCGEQTLADTDRSQRISSCIMRLFTGLT